MSKGCSWLFKQNVAIATRNKQKQNLGLSLCVSEKVSTLIFYASQTSRGVNTQNKAKLQCQIYSRHLLISIWLLSFLALKDETTKFIAKAASHIRKMVSRENGKIIFVSCFPLTLLSLLTIHEPKAFKEWNVTADRIKCIYVQSIPDM